VRDSLNLDISLLDFFEAPTVADQARIVEAELLRDPEDRGQDG
jgi:hypothetical protein